MVNVVIDDLNTYRISNHTTFHVSRLTFDDSPFTIHHSTVHPSQNQNYSSLQLHYMFKHLFKLIWNKKKQNFLLITEMFVSFLVLFAVFSMVVYFYQNYKKPRGFDYENVWVVSFSMPRHIQSNDSIT